MLEAEMEEHLGHKKYEYTEENKANYRNGTSKKKVKSNLGEIELEIPRDRKGEFEPVIVPKHSRDISNIEQQIINLFAMGNSIGKIISEIEFKFIIQGKNTAIATFQIELENKSIITIKGYDEIADYCYQKLKNNDTIIIQGRLQDDGKIIIIEDLRRFMKIQSNLTWKNLDRVKSLDTKRQQFLDLLLSDFGTK